MDSTVDLWIDKNCINYVAEGVFIYEMLRSMLEVHCMQTLDLIEIIETKNQLHCAFLCTMPCM